jgi:hypothetical protein
VGSWLVREVLYKCWVQLGLQQKQRKSGRSHMWYARATSTRQQPLKVLQAPVINVAAKMTVDLDDLPAPALCLVIQGLGNKARRALLRASKKYRDAVLASSESICLALKTGDQPALHQPLLQRACNTAGPGLRLVLKAARSGNGSCWQQLVELLQPLTQEGSALDTVHRLELQVSLG